MMGAVAGAVGLGVLAYLPVRHDAADPAFLHSKAEASARARLARELAKDGVPPEGGLAVFRNDPKFHARELWNDHCARCHSFTGELAASTNQSDSPTGNREAQGDGDGDGNGRSRGKEGPDFKGYNSRRWINAFLRDPNGPNFMGGARFANGMQPVQGTDEELRALTELVYAETGAADVDSALVADAEALFDAKDCSSCHERDGTTANKGPNLKGRGTLAYIVDVITDAGDPRLFGKRNKMPRFAGKLAPDEIAELARFVLDEARR
jgi:ubiquinol-cytochrome c reductase cytochrome b subunit